MLYLFPLHSLCKNLLNILYKISLLIISLPLIVRMEVIKSYGADFRSKERINLL